MWYTTRQEGFDDPRHTKRGPCLNLNSVLGACLRAGFALELISLTALYLAYWINGGFGLFGYDLAGMPESGRSNHTFRICLAVFSGLYMAGAAYILTFQGLLADDTCWARGFRTGSKILRLAAFFDILSSSLQFIFYLYVAKFYSAKWYIHFDEGGSEWVFFSFTRILHSLSFVMYGTALYLLEVYHDEGAGDLHAYINACFFYIAGLAEIFVIFFKYGSVCTALMWLALLAAATWSFFFEPEVNRVGPELYETELTNDIEQQVDLFSQKSPYRTQHEQGPLVPLKQQASVVADAYANQGLS